MITIAIVLKTGGIYDYRYVNNLVDGIKSNLTIPHTIVCLTNDETTLTSDIDRIIPFRHNWPKWWGKIELFRDDLFGEEQVFYLDLDTFVVGNLDQIFSYQGEFCALRDFYRLTTMGSGIMSWHGNKVHKIYNTFVQHPVMYINNMREGDQEFINIHKPSIEFFQDVFPKEIVSYKVHCIEGETHKMPELAKIICFHGSPRPHEITTMFKRYWNY
jgi:hypothetical protein